MSLVKPTLPSTASCWRLVGGRVLALVAMACGALSAVDAEQSTVNVAIINGRSQVHVTSTAPGRVIPPNQDAQFRLSLTPMPEVSSKQFYLRLNQAIVPVGTILNLMWNDDLNNDGASDVLIERPNGLGGWEAIPATLGREFSYRIIEGVTPDTVRVTIDAGFDRLDLKLRGEQILYLDGYVQALVIGLATGVGDGTVTGTNQSVNLQLISDKTVARNIVTSPNVREIDPYLNGGFISGDNAGRGRVWFGCEAWNPNNSYSGSVLNRTNTQAAMREGRIITQTLNSLASGLGVAENGQDFNATLRFGAARYQGEGIASVGPLVRDAFSLVNDQNLVIGQYAYRRTTEWGPSRVSTVYLIGGELPATWTFLAVTPKLGNNLGGGFTLERADPSTLTLPGYVTATRLTATSVQLDLSASMSVFVGDSVQFNTGETYIVSGTADPDAAPTSTYNPRNNGVTRKLAGNHPRMDVDYVTVSGVAVPTTARNIKAFFPNIQGQSGDIYYNAPGITNLVGGDFGGLTQLAITASAAGRPYSGAVALNPTLLTLDWGTADPATANIASATIGGEPLVVGTHYVMSTDRLTLTLTAAGQAKLIAGAPPTRPGVDPTRAFFRANPTVAFATGTATIVYEDLAIPSNDPLHYGTTGIKQGEVVNIWYTAERNNTFYVAANLPATETMAAVRVGAKLYYASKGRNGTLPETDEVSISVTDEGIEVKINEVALIAIGSSVTIYPAYTAATAPAPSRVGEFDPTRGLVTTVTKLPTVKLTTNINEPVLYGNPDSTGIYLLPVKGGNYGIMAGDQVRALGNDETTAGPRTWTCYGTTDEAVYVGTDPRARRWVSAWEDVADGYVALRSGRVLPGTFIIPRATSAEDARMQTHLEVPYALGSVTAMLPGRTTASGTYGGIYPLADPGDPANGAFQQGDYIEYFYKPLNDTVPEGKEEFSVILRQDGENNGYEVMDPQSSTFTVWDNESTLLLQSTTAMSIKTQSGTTTVLDSQNGQLSFILTRALPVDVVVNYTVEPGTLVFGDDFDIPGARIDASGVITGSAGISAGTTSVSVVFKPKSRTVITAREIKTIKVFISQNPSYGLGGVQSSNSGFQTNFNYTRDSGPVVITDPIPPNGVGPGNSGGGSLDGDDISANSKDGSGCGAGSGLGLFAVAMVGVALRRRKIHVQGDC